jgi:predicted ester cyclase
VSSVEENKNTVRQVLAAFEASDESAIENLHAPGFVAHGMPPGLSPDVEGMKKLAQIVMKGIGEPEITIDDLFGEGDRVALRFTHTGVHQGEMFGIPPSNRRVTVTGIEIYRMSDAGVAEYWGQIDMSDLFAGGQQG